MNWISRQPPGQRVELTKASHGAGMLLREIKAARLSGGPTALGRFTVMVVWEAVAGPDGQPLLMFVMITTPPNDLIGRVTDRMPADAKALLVPYAGELDMALQPKPTARPRSDETRPHAPPLL